MCDKMKDTDERLNSITIKGDSCIQNENRILEDCLKANENDWRKCTAQILALKKCFENKSLKLEEKTDTKRS